MDSLAVLFILAQGLDVVHDVWWQTVLIFFVRVLILICDHGPCEKLHFLQDFDSNGVSLLLSS